MADKCPMDYIRTFFTNRSCNGRLECFGQKWDEPYTLLFAIPPKIKRERSMSFEVYVTEDGISFGGIGYKKKYSETDVDKIMNAVAKIGADYERWRNENERKTGGESRVQKD